MSLQGPFSPGRPVRGGAGPAARAECINPEPHRTLGDSQRQWGMWWALGRRGPTVHGADSSGGCRLPSPGSPCPARAEPRRCAQDAFATGQHLRAGMSAQLGVVCPLWSACAHLSPHAWSPACAHVVGPELEGVQVGWVPCGQQPLLVLLSVCLCLLSSPCCLPEGLGAKRQRGRG